MGLDVTDRKRAEEALCHSEAELKEAQRVGRLGSWTLDLKTGQAKWSEELYRMLGIGSSLPAVPYEEQRRLFTPESWARLSSELDKTVSTGVAYELELETVLPDQSHGWMLARGEPVCDCNGAVICLRGTSLDITERKQAEEQIFKSKTELQNSQANIAALFESVTDLIWSVDRQHAVLTFNSALANHLHKNYGTEVHSGARPQDILPPDRAAIWPLLYEKAVAEGPFLREYALTDGRILELALHPIVEDRKTTGVSVFGKDITERKQAEAARRRVEANLSALVESTTDMIWSVDRQYRLSTINKALQETIERIHGIRLALGKKPEELLPPATAAEWGQMYERALSEGAYRVEYCSTYDRSLALTFNPIVQDGQATGISVFAKDISDRKRAELALQQSEREFRTLAELVPQLVWMCTPDGLNIYFNQRWVDYTGLSLEESYGGGWNTPFHPDDKQPAWNCWNHAVTTGDTYRIECRLRAAVGSYRWFLIRGVPLCDASGDIVKWFGTCTDIEDLKRAQEELHLGNERLEQRVCERTADLLALNKELESFTYAVAHDLRAPLRHIHGFSDLLLHDNDSALGGDGHHYLECILNGTSRMERLLEDLLNLSRLGRRPVNRRTVALEKLVQEVIDDLAPETANRLIEWKLDRLPVVDCDLALMRIVFTNLLANAVKFTRPRPTAVIEIGQTTVNGEAAVFVRDNGAGFDMRYIDKLFGVFQRLHLEKDFEGTGVGLATVQRILLKHGGRIWAEAEVDKGATFYFTLGSADAIAEQPVAAGEAV